MKFPKKRVKQYKEFNQQIIKRNKTILKKMKMRGIMILCLVVLILCNFVPKCEPFNKVCFERCLKSCNFENDASNVHNKNNCVGKCTSSLLGN